MIFNFPHAEVSIDGCEPFTVEDVHVEDDTAPLYCGPLKQEFTMDFTASSETAAYLDSLMGPPPTEITISGPPELLIGALAALLTPPGVDR